MFNALMGFISRWLIKGLILVVIVAVGLYFLQGLKEVSLEEFEITGIDQITTESFTIIGNLNVNNPSDVKVPISSIEYLVVLEDTKEEIGSGDIGKFILESETVSKIEFNQKVNWVPTATVASKLVLEDEVWINVVGEIVIDIVKLRDYPLPFSKRVDIKEYVEQFANDAAPKLPNEDLPSENIELPVSVDELDELGELEE
jgi:LEA14-like dessication related protein